MRRRHYIPRHPDHSILQEASGACGDLGTFIPHVIGAITVAVNPALGLIAGWIAELIRAAIVRRFISERIG